MCPAWARTIPRSHKICGLEELGDSLSDNKSSERQVGAREGVRRKKPWQRHDRRDTNGQRGRTWAMSVLVNAKSNSHRKTRHVESGGTGLSRSCTLPGEISVVRATEKSAEAIVA